MKENTIEEKLFHQLMRLERMMRRPGGGKDAPNLVKEESATGLV